MPTADSTGGSNLGHAPPTRTIDGLVAAPIDISHIEAQLVFDAATETSTGDATLHFTTGSTAANPIFDLRQAITGLWLDGTAMAVDSAAHHEFGGGNDAELRILEAVLAPNTTHALQISYDLGQPNASTAGSYQPAMVFSAGPRLTFNFGFTDLGAGRYLEAWIPANLIYDQFTLDLNLTITGTTIAHTLITNGSATSLGPNQWLASFPSSTTAFSPLVELRASDSVIGANGVASLPVSGENIAIEAWKLATSSIDLDDQIDLIAGFLVANEASTGPYLHGNRFVAFFHVGGMEYDGGTTTSTSALRHEVFHSWWGRGIRPASQRDAWWDEAWTVYNDFGAVGASPFDFTDPPITLAPRNPWSRVTPAAAYSAGRQFFDGVASLIGAASLRTLMAEFAQRCGTSPTSTVDLEAFLLARTGQPQLVDAFGRFVYGFPTSGADLWLRDEVGHGGADYWQGRFWDSPDLWVRNEDDGGSSHQNPEFGQDNWIYARVRNRGDSPADHFAVVFNVLSFAGTQFSYPGDFLPGVATAAGFGVDVGGRAVLKACWHGGDVPPAGTHACLTAVALTAGDHPVPGRHVWQHNSLAQKNLTVVDLVPGDWLLVPVLVKNLLRRDRRFTIELARPAEIPDISAGLLHRSGSIFRSRRRPRSHTLPLSKPVENRKPTEITPIIGSSANSNYIAHRFLEAVELPFEVGATARLAVALPGHSQSVLGLRLALPSDIKPGHTFKVDLVQRETRTKRILGGVAVQVNTVDRP